MKKNDVILGGGILIAALLLFLVMHLTRGEEGNQIQITVDGTVYGTYSLAKDQVIEVKENAPIYTWLVMFLYIWLDILFIIM